MASVKAEEGGFFEESAVSFLADALKLWRALSSTYKNTDAKALSAPRMFVVPVPSMHRNTPTFPRPTVCYIGRSWFQELHAFVTGLMKEQSEEPVSSKRLKQSEEPVSSKRLKQSEDQSEEQKFAEELVMDKELLPITGDEEQSEEQLAEERMKMEKELLMTDGLEAYILGPPGEGKSYALAVLAGLLRVTEPSFATVYISAKRVVKSPHKVLQGALLLAFSDDPVKVAALKGCADLQGLLGWLDTTSRALVLVDDFNDLDEARLEGDTSEAHKRIAARSWLEELSGCHIVVYCSSASSKCRLPLTRRSPDPYMVIGGGFSDEEYSAFTKYTKMNITEKGLEKSGRNPWLLQQHVNGELNTAVAELEADLGKFVRKLTAKELSEFMEHITGGTIPRLPQAMDSGCFVPKNGKLVATSGYLLSAARQLCSTLRQKKAD